MSKHIHTTPSSSRNIIHLGAVVSTHFPLQENKMEENSHTYIPPATTVNSYSLISAKKNAQQASKYLKAGECEYLNQWVVQLYL